MTPHHCEHLKSYTKEYKEQEKHGWQYHVGKTELQEVQYILMDDSLVIQPTALLSCKASSCQLSTEASHITKIMDIQSEFTNTLSQNKPIMNTKPYVDDVSSAYA
jgi:hypothetical protein